MKLIRSKMFSVFACDTDEILLLLFLVVLVKFAHGSSLVCAFILCSNNFHAPSDLELMLLQLC